MHLIESYALALAAKIGKPQIKEEFYPLLEEKYITFQPRSKYESKNYDYWPDVLIILSPILNAAGIKIIQLGTQDDRAMAGCIHLQGKTTLNQVQYLIKRSILHLGADSVGCHLASGSDRPIVALYSNNWADNVRPYWTKPENMVLFEPDRQKFPRPSYAANEQPKSINSIKPEEIAKAVCKLLGLEFNFNYTSVFHGGNYSNKIIELAPDCNIDISNLGINQLVVRMDYIFNEQILANQLNACNCSIVTDRVINKDILTFFKSKITQLIYVIDGDNQPDFVKFVQKLGIPIGILSYKDTEWVKEQKLRYSELGVIINRHKTLKSEISELKDIPNENLFYRTGKFLISNSKIYHSKAAWMNGIAAENLNPVLNPVIDNDIFWGEAEYFSFYQKI